MALSDVSIQNTWSILEIDIPDIPNQATPNLSDFSGVAYTRRIINTINTTSTAADQCFGYKFGIIATGNWYLPTIGELWLIYKNITDIDNALLKVGKPILKKTRYWSSNEFDGALAWNINLDTGIMHHATKIYTSCYVRACMSLPKYQNAILAYNSEIGDFIYNDYTICKQNNNPEIAKVIGICYDANKYASSANRMMSIDDLKLSPEDISFNADWGIGGTDIPNVQNYSQWPGGSRVQDSREIIKFRGVKDYNTWSPSYNQPTDYPAASLCDMYYTQLGKVDQTTWWLPSAGDMSILYTNKNIMHKSLSIISKRYLWNQHYWTSTEYDKDYAWVINWNDGNKDYRNKANGALVRACSRY